MARGMTPRQTRPSRLPGARALAGAWILAALLAPAGASAASTAPPAAGGTAAPSAGVATTTTPASPASTTATPQPGTSTPAAGASAGAPAGSAAPTRPRVHRSTTLSTPAIVLAALAGLIVLGGLAWGLARTLAYEPRWVQSSRHALAEGGFRASATWAEFADWARMGR
jgi:cobalamin biosynthesis Mg chelatase CobN